MGNEPKSDFCSLCGMDIQGDPRYPHLHLMCPSCAASGVTALKSLEEGSDAVSQTTVSGSWDGNLVRIVTYVNDLGPSRRPSHISRWPKKVFEALAQDQRVNFPATCWIFPARFLPAIERILQSIGKALVIYDRN